MLSLLGTLFGGIVDGVKTHFQNKQELEKVKLEAMKVTIQSKAEIEKAIALSKTKQAEAGQLNDFSLDKLAMQNMEKSYKDEFILAIFSIPMILAFIYPDIALAGFTVIDKMPVWYQYTFIGIVVVIYGMRGLLTKFLDGRISRGKVL